MRIIAGVAKGRRLTPPVGDGVRPTGDRVKEAWFSSLAPRLRGAHVLDLYSGSGALGLEAASRGAAVVVSVERDRDALAVVEGNVAAAGLDVTVLGTDVRVAVGSGPSGPGAHPTVAAAAPFDIVLADPPYRIDPEELGGVLAALLPLLADDGEVWIETHRDTQVPWPAGLVEERARRYGDTVLHTGRRGDPQPGA